MTNRLPSGAVSLRAFLPGNAASLLRVLFQRVLAIAASALIAIAIGEGYLLIRAQAASGKASPEALRLAVSVGDAEAIEQWAGIAPEDNAPAGDASERGTGDEGTREQALWLAVASNPRAASAWIALGFTAERRRDLAHAREYFERAYRVDHQYLPAWTLANFCFRVSADACFWRAARRAAEVAAPDKALSEFVPLLRLADLREASFPDVLERLGGAPRLERAYLDDLIAARRWTDAVEVADRIASRHNREDDARMDDFIDRLIDAADREGIDIDQAVGIWNKMRRFTLLDPVHAPLTNGSLATEPLHAGFDWRISSNPVIASHWEPGEIRFALTGRTVARPHPAEPLVQVLPLAAGRYRLRFEYRTQTRGAADTPSSGFRWSAPNIEGRPLAASASWREADFAFRTARRGYCRLVLRYGEEPERKGTTVSQIDFREFRLEAM